MILTSQRGTERGRHNMVMLSARYGRTRAMVIESRRVVVMATDDQRQPNTFPPRQGDEHSWRDIILAGTTPRQALYCIGALALAFAFLIAVLFGLV